MTFTSLQYDDPDNEENTFTDDVVAAAGAVRSAVVRHGLEYVGLCVILTKSHHVYSF